MAKVIQEPPAPSRERYPWDEWLDGQWWELEQGVDFKTTVNSIRAGAFFAARRRNMKAICRVVNDTTIRVKGIRLCPGIPESIPAEHRLS